MKALQLLKDAWVNSGEATKVAMVLGVVILAAVAIAYGGGEYIAGILGI